MAYNFSLYHFTPDHKIHQSHIASDPCNLPHQRRLLSFWLVLWILLQISPHLDFKIFSILPLIYVLFLCFFLYFTSCYLIRSRTAGLRESCVFQQRIFFQRCMGIPSPNTSFSNLAHHRNIFTTFCRMFSLSEHINILKLKNLVLYLDFLKMQLACKILLLCQCYLISKLFRNRNPKFQ